MTIADDQEQSVRPFEYIGRVEHVVVAPDGRHIAISAPGSSDSVLNAETFATIFKRESLQTFGFLPDGKGFAFASPGESQIQLYDIATERQTDSIPCEPESQEPWIQFSQDGKRVATSYDNYAASTFGVSIYDKTTKQRIHRITGHTGRVFAAYFSPDGCRIFTKSFDGTVRLWDVENGFELLVLRDSAEMPDLPTSALTRDGQMIAFAGMEGVFLKKAATPQQVAAWQRLPAQAPDIQWWKRLGGIQEWLVLAPIHLREQVDFSADLDKQQLPDEAGLDPQAGEVGQVGGEKFTWQQVTTSDCVLDLQKVTSPKEDNCLAYTVTHIYSDAPRERVRLLVGSDDLSKIYLNGNPIYEFRRNRPAIPADDEVLIDLRKGKNVLVCKVIDQQQSWGVSAQVVGEDYQPIPGVTTGIRPGREKQ
jgi:hypothetical protein